MKKTTKSHSEPTFTTEIVFTVEHTEKVTDPSKVVLQWLLSNNTSLPEGITTIKKHSNRDKQPTRPIFKDRKLEIHNEEVIPYVAKEVTDVKDTNIPEKPSKQGRRTKLPSRNTGNKGKPPSKVS